MEPNSAASGTVGRSAKATSLLVAVATIVANLLSYGFNLIMSRSLGVAGFGELSALLAIALVGTVPGTALQALIARRLGGDEDAAAHAKPLMWAGAAVSLVVGGLLVVIAPLLRDFLDVSSWAALLWLALWMVPTTMANACQGVLQGEERFVGFGILLVSVQAAKMVAGGAAAVSDTGVAGALSAATIATFAVVFLAIPVTMRNRWSHGSGMRPGLGRLGSELLRDSGAVLSVLILSNLDLLLARHYLSDQDAGLYAAGNLVTRAAFWAPSFVAIVAYPRLARAADRPRALRHSYRLMALLGAITVAAAAVGGPLLPFFVGNDYRAVSSLAWLFALQGFLLAVVLLDVYAGMAVHDRRLSIAAWLVAAMECVVIGLGVHGGIRSILTVVVIGSATLVGIGAFLLRGEFAEPTPPVAVREGQQAAS